MPAGIERFQLGISRGRSADGTNHCQRNSDQPEVRCRFAVVMASVGIIPMSWQICDRLVKGCRSVGSMQRCSQKDEGRDELDTHERTFANDNLFSIRK